MDRKLIVQMLDDLSEHHRTPGEVLKQAILARLSKSLDSYQEDLQSSKRSLERTEPSKVMRELNRKTDNV